MFEPAAEPAGLEEERQSAAWLGHGRVAVLGLNAWAVLVAVPFALAAPRAWASILPVSVPLIALVIGVRALNKRQALATWSLLFGFPVLCAGVAGWLPALVLERPHSTVGILLGALSLIAYGTAALPETEYPRQTRPITVQPLGSVNPIEDDPVAQWSRRILIGCGFGLALFLPVVAPSVGSISTYEPAWQGSAPAAATLASIYGATVASGTIALIIGPMLRAPRRTPWTQKQRRRRVIGLLVGAAFGTFFYAIYRLA